MQKKPVFEQNYEELFKQITENMLDVIGKTDANMCFDYVSPSYKKVLGYDTDEMLGEYVLNYVHPDDYQNSLMGITKLITNQESEHIVLRHRHKDGHYIWLETVGTALNEQGNFSGSIFVSRDITERKKTEATLRKTESNYQGLFNSMQEGFALWEIICDENQQPMDYKFLDINPTYERTTRVSKEKLIGTLMSEQNFIIEDYWWKLFEAVAVSGQAQQYEGYFSHLNTYFEVFAFRPNQCSIACLLVDISRRRKAEIELENEKERLAVTLGSIGEGVISTDVDSRVLFLNQVAAEILGWSQESAVGQHLSDVLNTVEHIYMNTQSHSGSLSGFIESQTAEINDNMVCIVRNGVRRYLANSASLIRDRDGKDLGMVMVLRDVTDKKLAEEQIQYLSYNDKLTGVYNRAYVDVILAELENEEQLPVSLIMGDVNGLKLTNDVFGHQEGDRILVKLAEIIKKCCRDSDIVARWGGDEFLIILPRTNSEVAIKVCERIGKSCQEAGADPIELSIALGTATREDSQQNMVEVFRLAEDRMYSNKLLASKCARTSMIAGLQKTLREHSHENEEHTSRLMDMAVEMGVALNRDKTELDELAVLASLHDIGNVAIAQEVLMKADYLDEDDWEKIKKHPLIGYRMAQLIPEISSIAEAILAHHERWDGSGYPQGLQEEQIPFLARVFSVIDAYDIMTYGCVYKGTLTHEAALEEIRRGSGSQFDPEIAAAFIKLRNAKP